MPDSPIVENRAPSRDLWLFCCARFRCVSATLSKSFRPDQMTDEAVDFEVNETILTDVIEDPPVAPIARMEAAPTVPTPTEPASATPDRGREILALLPYFDGLIAIMGASLDEAVFELGFSFKDMPVHPALDSMARRKAAMLTLANRDREAVRKQGGESGVVVY
jgi:hypothetical protein